MHSRTYKKYYLKMNIFIKKINFICIKKQYRWIKIISSKLKHKQFFFVKKKLLSKKKCKTRDKKEKVVKLR